MLTIEIPGRDSLLLEHLLLDYNGTIATDGHLLEGVAERLARLAETVQIHILTADTFGTVTAQCQGLPAVVKTFPAAGAALWKAQIAHNLSGGIAAVGNGYNDAQMYDAADLAIQVLGEEGCCVQALAYADILVRNVQDALDLLLKPGRLKATLRS